MITIFQGAPAYQRRGARAVRECSQGHMIEGANQYTRASGYTECRECKAAAQRRYAVRQQYAYAVPLRLIVFRRGDGTGNEAWTKPFVWEVLCTVHRGARRLARLERGAWMEWRESPLFALSVQEAVAWGEGHARMPGTVTVLVSGAAGASAALPARDGGWNTAPVVVLRGGGQGTPVAVAAMILEGLGRQIGRREGVSVPAGPLRVTREEWQQWVAAMRQARKETTNELA